MKDLTKIYIDLRKCTEDERNHIFSLLPEPINEEDYMIFDSFYNLHSDNERWYCGSSWVSIAKTELTYPEFIKLFEGGEGEIQTYTKEDIENAYRAGENKQTYYFKDTTVILPTTYEGVDG